MLWGILIISLSLNKSDHNLPPQSTVTETHICTDDPMGKKKKNKKQKTKHQKPFEVSKAMWQPPAIQSSELKLGMGLQAK